MGLLTLFFSGPSSPELFSLSTTAWALLCNVREESVAKKGLGSSSASGLRLDSSNTELVSLASLPSLNNSLLANVLLCILQP